MNSRFFSEAAHRYKVSIHTFDFICISFVIYLLQNPCVDQVTDPALPYPASAAVISERKRTQNLRWRGREQQQRLLSAASSSCYQVIRFIRWLPCPSSADATRSATLTAGRACLGSSACSNASMIAAPTRRRWPPATATDFACSPSAAWRWMVRSDS